MSQTDGKYTHKGKEIEAEHFNNPIPSFHYPYSHMSSPIVPHAYFPPPTYPQNMYSPIPPYTPPTTGSGGRNGPPPEGLQGTAMSPGANLDQAQKIREVVLEVVSQLVSKVQCNITPSYPLHTSPLDTVKPLSNNTQNVQVDKLQTTHPPTPKNVTNLAKHKLTPNALSILKKGLSFIPTPHLDMSRSLNHKDLHNELASLKEKYIDRWVPSIPDRSNRLMKCSMMAIKFDFDKLSVAGVKQNMTYGERCALRSLVRNKRIVISKADKGDAT